MVKDFKFIYFDAGLTLLANNHASLFRRALESLGYKRTMSEVERAYHLANKEAMRHALLHRSDGREKFAFYFLEYLGLDVSVKDFRAAYEDIGHEFRWSAFPFARAVLEKLKGDGFKIGILSNWDRSLRSILEREGLLSLFDEVVISSEVGYEKPDEKIFRIALEKASCQAAECLFVGDNYYDDVIGAEKLGIATALINPGNLGIEDLDYKGIVIGSIMDLVKG